MRIKELETLNNFVTSNNSFYDAIKDLNNLNIYIKIELILLYFKINYNNLNILSGRDYEIIIDIIINNNFTIEANKIKYNGSIYQIEYFLSLVKQMEISKDIQTTSKVIKFNVPPKKVTKKNSKKLKVIDLQPYQRKDYFTMKEREFLFEKNTKINIDTLPFILETNSYFKELANYLILNILNGKLDDINSNYLDLLFSYLSLYPFVSYSKNKFDIPFHKLDLPQNEIGLKKSTYEDDYLSNLENDNKELEQKRQRLISNRTALEQNLMNYEAKIGRLNDHILAIEQKQVDNYYSYYAYRHTKEVYNENLLQYLLKSFEQGNIFINESFENPIIKFFSINTGEVEFYCAMHLSTFSKLCDSTILLPNPDTQKKLLFNT